VRTCPGLLSRGRAPLLVREWSATLPLFGNWLRSHRRKAERGISLEAQAEKIRAMALVQGAELSEVIVESGESAKSLNRPGMAKLLAMMEGGKVKAVIVAKLDRLTRSVKDLCKLLERFERRGAAWRWFRRPRRSTPARQRDVRC
jgi:hypothetical protein